MSACVEVVISAWTLTVRVTSAAPGPDGLATVPVEVSVHVTRDGQTARVLSLTEMDRLLRIEESDPADDGRPPDET